MTAAQLENPFAGQGSVLLDIGGDVGALVVTMPASMEGVEVEIRPAGSATVGDHQDGHHDDGHHHDGGDHHGHHHDGHHPHVAVVNRPVRGESVPSLVFPDLQEGRYELYVKETNDVHMTADVRGGEVATATW